MVIALTILPLVYFAYTYGYLRSFLKHSKAIADPIKFGFMRDITTSLIFGFYRERLLMKDESYIELEEMSFERYLDNEVHLEEL